MKTIEEELEEEKFLNWFCPQINDDCNHGCYCYIPPKILNIDGVDQLQSAFCIHAMHQEQIEIIANVQL